MVAGEVVNNSSGIGHLEYSFNDFPMSGREVLFPKLPCIDDISIEYESGRLNLLQIIEKLLCPASMGPQVQIGKHAYIKNFLHIKIAD